MEVIVMSTQQEMPAVKQDNKPQEQSPVPMGTQKGVIVEAGKVHKVLINVEGFKPFRYKIPSHLLPAGQEFKVGDIVEFVFASNSTKYKLNPINFSLTGEKTKLEIISSLETYFQSGEIPTVVELSTHKVIDIALSMGITVTSGQEFELQFAQRTGLSLMGAVQFIKDGKLGPVTSLIFAPSDDTGAIL